LEVQPFTMPVRAQRLMIASWLVSSFANSVLATGSLKAADIARRAGGA
jgi:hypothetical protein